MCLCLDCCQISRRNLFVFQHNKFSLFVLLFRSKQQLSGALTSQFTRAVTQIRWRSVMWNDLRLNQSTSKGRRWRGHLTKVPPGCLLGQVFLGGGPGTDPGRLCCNGDLIIGKGWMDG